MIKVTSTECDTTLLANPTSTSTRSKKSWTVIGKWIETCVTSHKTCNAYSPGQYPSRLIELPRLESEVKVVRLINPDLETLDGVYATLSHRWGEADMLKLLRSNMAEIQKGILVQDLSGVVQEAIMVLSRMGIRYLWVDHLCILQEPDEKLDWLHESSRMEEYYGNAFINIAATASTDGSQGLFRWRDPEKLRHQRVVVLSSSSEVDQEYTIINVSRWDAGLDQAILNTRALQD